MSEKKDYAAFRKNVIEPRDRMERVENLLVLGMPDVNYCGNGVEVWIEFKSPTEPKRPQTKLFGSNHRMSQDQKNWFKTHLNAGGKGFVVIATDIRWIIVNAIYADEINDMTVNELTEVASWTSIKPIKDKTEWKNLRKILLKK